MRVTAVLNLEYESNEATPKELEEAIRTALDNLAGSGDLCWTTTGVLASWEAVVKVFD